VDEHGAVGLDEQESGRQREVGGEPAEVVDTAAGDDETHPGSLAGADLAPGMAGAGAPPPGGGVESASEA
jgi:hypothetical protein